MSATSQMHHTNSDKKWNWMIEVISMAEIAYECANNYIQG